MPKIVITEIDETTPGVFAESTDVVYIPGFVNLQQSCLYDEKTQEYIGLELNTPTLFTSVAQFETLCGTEPVVFAEQQMYENFCDDAVPYHGVMFEAGDPDPAYIMAKELLASGLSVMYERINPGESYKRIHLDDVGHEVATDFAKNPENYYTYVPYNAETMLGGFNKLSDVYDSAPQFSTGNYLKLIYGTSSRYVTLISRPDDWDTNWGEYYELKHVPAVPGYQPCTVPVWGLYNNVIFMKQVAEDYINIKTMYDALEQVFDSSNEFGIVDRGNYSVKYLTSGGYPVFEYISYPNTVNAIVTKMLKMAETRGDCVALIDHTDYIDRVRNANDARSVYQAVVKGSTESSVWGNGDFGTMFTPWATYNRITTDDLQNGEKGTSAFRAPASFAYLTSLADSIKTNANWLAIAGVTRGKVLNVGNMTTIIPNTVADAMQPRQGMSVNAITNIKPYGYTIWGNRTLKQNAENLVATSFLNVRNLVSDVKKVCYRVARSLTFEQDTEVLWINFKSGIQPTLDRMLTGYGISGYKIVRDNSHPGAAEKATICARVILYPTYAVEDFYITVVLKDDEVTVE